MDNKQVAAKLVKLAGELTDTTQNRRREPEQVSMQRHASFQDKAVEKHLREALKSVNEALKIADEYGFANAYTDIMRVKDRLVKIRKSFM